MKVLMLCEYFTPFDSGGSEWSSYYLAKGLVEESQRVVVITPNYGSAKSQEIIDGIKIIRFPFYIKIGQKRGITPYWQTNLLWNLWTFFYVLKYTLAENVDIIHIQGKYFLPSAITTKFLLGKKVVISLRDYLVLCPIGMCLKQVRRTCSFGEFLGPELKEYSKNYLHGMNVFIRPFVLLAAIRLRFYSLFLKWLLQFCDRRVAISDLVKDMYKKNGVKEVETIPNSFHFIEKKQVRTETKHNFIVFAGRLTRGKGADMLIDIFKVVLKQFPALKLKVFGDGPLRQRITQQIKQGNLAELVTLSSYISHDQLMEEFRNAKASLTPSAWLEPFGRIPLESLGNITPVVVSRNSGVASYIKNGRWGKLAGATINEMIEAVIFVLKNNDELLSNIRKDYDEIRKTFSEDVCHAYLSMYKGMLK